jgi:hypothetical protein
MIQIKMVQTYTGRHDEDRKQLERNLSKRLGRRKGRQIFCYLICIKLKEEQNSREKVCHSDK